MAVTNIEKELRSDTDRAQEALAEADVNEMHVLFTRANERFAKMETAFASVVSHYAGTKDTPHYVPNNDNAIAAMERVAMEALTLARFVVEQARKSE